MCGRFTLTADMQAISAHFSLTNHAVMKPRYNIAPDQVVPVIRTPGQIEFLTWGLRPHWLPLDQKSFFNARAETIADKPAFRKAFRARRCLVIADGFYEWRVVGKIKQPYYVTLPGRAIFAFAGIWEGDTCAIITRAQRPLILDPSAYAQWLAVDNAISDVEKLSNLDKNSSFTIYPVSTIVNNVQHDVAACVQSLQ